MSDIEAILERASASPVAMAKVARNLLLSDGQVARARAVCDRALAMAPGDGEVRAIRDEVFSAGVGAWDFNMMQDDSRHLAIGRALDRALKSGGRVLDIGTGTGLLAMMAARAGADEVISCEQVLEVAEAARAVIAANGLADRVRVVARSSSELVIGEDMEGPADVLVFDNFGSTLIGLGALPTVEDAMRRLVKPGGAIIPARCAIKAALAEDLQPGRHRMGKVQGFDLSPINALAKPVYTIDSDSERLAIRSSAATLFAFDFSRGGPFQAERKVLEVVGRGGGANGVVQWLEFAIDEHDDYRTGSGARGCAFGLVFHPAMESFEATSGGTFKIGASHDRNGLWIWLEPS